MRYSLLLTDAVRDYLFRIPLSREGRVRVFSALHTELCARADSHIGDVGLRLAPGSDCFWFNYLLRDTHGDGRFHHLRFLVSDAAAVYGLLRVVYVEKEVAG